MMRFVFTVLFCSLWSSSFARPFLSTVPLVRREIDINDPRLPAGVKTICEGGINATTVLEFRPFGTSGATLTTGICTPPADAAASSDSDDALAALKPGCPTALNDCNRRFPAEFSRYNGLDYVAKCGAPCTSSCYPGSGGPDPNDCQTMVNRLYNEPLQLFTMTENQWFLFEDSRTCGIGVQNQIARSAPSLGCDVTMIYDYSDVGSIAQYLAWNCQAAQGAKGGRCRGNTGIFQPRIPDFYVQVYRKPGTR